MAWAPGENGREEHVEGNMHGKSMWQEKGGKTYEKVASQSGECLKSCDHQKIEAEGYQMQWAAIVREAKALHGS